MSACTCPPSGPWHQDECPANTYTHPSEEEVIATLKRVRSVARRLLDSIDVKGHIRFCDECWDRGELSARCQDGSAISARIDALEDALRSG